MTDEQRALENVKRNIRKWRLEHGYTYRQLARLSHISPSAIQSVESTGGCQLATLLAIASGLKIHPSRLFEDAS